MTKDERIKAEFSRLIVFFDDIAVNKRTCCEKLIQNAAFMSVELEDLQTVINNDGATEKYQNGANQSGMKTSAALQAYNALIKNYNSVMKQLLSLLPDQPGTASRLTEFIKELE